MVESIYKCYIEDVDSLKIKVSSDVVLLRIWGAMDSPCELHYYCNQLFSFGFRRF